MRGCFFVLIVGAALLSAVAWFGAQPLAGSLVGAALSESGFSATERMISVIADPPIRLFTGQADRVTIDATDVEWRTLHAAHLTLELGGVDLFGRTAATVSGQIDGARVASDATASSEAVAEISIAGRADAAAATVTTDRATVRALVLAAVERQFGVHATDVALAAPNRLILTAPGARLEGTFVVSAPDALGISTALGTVTVLRIDPEIPIHLRAVSATSDLLRLDAVFDVDELLRGSASSAGSSMNVAAAQRKTSDAVWNSARMIAAAEQGDLHRGR